jgi:hypothetical protein
MLAIRLKFTGSDAHRNSIYLSIASIEFREDPVVEGSEGFPNYFVKKQDPMGTMDHGW